MSCGGLDLAAGKSRDLRQMTVIISREIKGVTHGLSGRPYETLHSTYTYYRIYENLTF